MGRKGKMVDKRIDSEYLHEEMTLTIYHPATISTSATYNICIMQDGNDYYQMGRIATLSDRLHDNRTLSNTIFIGIHYQDKFDRKKKYHPSGEQNPDYIKFLAYEVLPLLNELVPATDNEKVFALMGDSLAGTLALMTALKHPKSIQKIIMQSPYVDDTVLDAVDNVSDMQSFDIYHTIGTDETDVLMTDGERADFVTTNRKLHERLSESGANYIYHELEDAKHTWKYWQKDMKRVLETMFD